MTVADAQRITMREAARRLRLVPQDAPRRAQDLAAQQLRRRIETRERETGMRVIAKVANPKSPCVTLSGIRAACPEFRLAPSQVDEVRRIVAQLDEQIDERVMTYTEPRFAEQAQINEVLSGAAKRSHQRLDALERRVRDLESAPVCTTLHQDGRGLRRGNAGA
jgi:hypothetical protein